MYQLLFYVNVPVPADTCLTRTADRAILDCVPGMKRTVVITIKYYDNFNDFGTALSVRYLVLFTILNREAETVAIFNAGRWANWAACATGDDLLCESLYFTLVPYIILQNFVY